jgi:hypothetical protein
MRMVKRSRAGVFDCCADALDDHSIKAAQATKTPEMRIGSVSGR